MVLVIIAIVRARSHPHPAVDLDVVAGRDAGPANLATLLFAAGFFAKILCDVLFLTSVWGYSVLHAGLAMSPSPLITALTAGFIGRLAARVGHRAVILPGLVMYAGGCIWYAMTLQLTPHYVTLFLPATIFTGIGMACALPMLTSAAVTVAGERQFGSASAVNATARQLGGTLGIAALVAILSGASVRNAVEIFHGGWWFVAATALLALTPSAVLRK